MFGSEDQSHQHSLQTLNTLYEFDDFMVSIDTLADIGCGTGKDIEWWATRTTRDEVPVPLNIKCTGIDMLESLPVAKRYNNITYQKTDFEDVIHPPKKLFDVLWCHDSFQYCINPIATLSKWWHITADNGMLILIVPQTTNINQRHMQFNVHSGSFYHYTTVNLIHMLAVAGWDCKSGFFLKQPHDSWIHAIVYKSPHEPVDPRKTSLYNLIDKNLLPESAERGINKHGYLRQQDLVLPWVDKSLMSLDQQ